MTKTLIITFIIIASIPLLSAQDIHGKVNDMTGEPIPGVNVYLKDTYDGATSDLNGNFLFHTEETGVQTIVASFIGYKKYELQITIGQPISLNIILREDVNRLSGVTITAGSFEASDEKKSVVLKPLDIAMTAGATADISGALNTLPGATTNGETGRLFVRGGTANETQAFIDGVLVQNFYQASPNNVPSRSRFSPFLFKGTYFSTGGYSAEYGQALSSILSLNSQDLPDQTQSDISLMTVGTDIAHTQKWENGSVYGQLQYTNLEPYMGLVPQDFEWNKGPISTNGTFMLRQKMNKSNFLKVYTNYDFSTFDITAPNINQAFDDKINLENRNFFFNTSYRLAMGASSSGYIGVSYGKTQETTVLNETKINDAKSGYHAKTYFATDIANVSLKIGGEIINAGEKELIDLNDGSVINQNYKNNLYVSFSEADYFITNELTLRAGLRYSYYTIFRKNILSPRLSMAIKTGEKSQISMAYGHFHQLPNTELLLRSKEMSFERADHYLLNYQTTSNRATFRIEAYYKNYKDLVKFDPLNSYNPLAYNNSGSGYARGIDLFWRDNLSIKNGQYWISYALIDTKRDFKDYPNKAVPTFAARHNLSLVYKHFIPALKTQFGTTYSFNSGRPYNDPNQEVFNNRKTTPYSNLSFNLAFLWKPNVILYASATNLLGRDNVFGYSFEKDPGMDGYYDSMKIGQAAKRFYFVGLFITLTKNNKTNNLENL